ncbi:hypothetical protein [Aeoliella mucimassa]|uniref:Uncharacterized protein n=1 Tax=Aeoliella mucimassa TaxID=2527972 RepID=A0A518ALM9_9BACT|nr:hypothetical protein [Aeoliella mucimassa]QDU55606.1 hypothetical protein Pan181_17980 [Aeoliella mucimassa]
MPSWWIFRLPKFSLGQLLWITVAVAAGLAVGRPLNASDEVSLRWFPACEATGALLMVFAMVGHLRSLVRIEQPTSRPLNFARWNRFVACLCMTFGICILLILSILFERAILEKPRGEESLMVWTPLWPDTLWIFCSLASVRLFLCPPNRDRRAGRLSRTINLLTIGTGLIFGGFVLVNRSNLTMLVHVAINHIESYEPLWLQREGAFPHHQLEGYFSFWAATIAAMVVVATALILVRESRRIDPSKQSTARWLFVAGLLALAGFDLWFHYCEFPRINPDMASVGTARLASDTLAGILMLVGLVWWLATSSAAQISSPEQLDVPKDARSLLLLLGSGFVAVASLRAFVDVALRYEPASLAEVLEMYSDMLMLSEFSTALLVTISALALGWQILRHPEKPLLVRPIDPRRFTYYFCAWGALVIVGIPVLKAFSMCFWLGPLVL